MYDKFFKQEKHLFKSDDRFRQRLKNITWFVISAEDKYKPQTMILQTYRADWYG